MEKATNQSAITNVGFLSAAAYFCSCSAVRAAVCILYSPLQNLARVTSQNLRKRSRGRVSGQVTL
jgi:hypothetical protein